MKRLLTALAAIAALCAAASAAPDEKVDRARLRNAAQLPSVAPDGWYYGIACDGRVFEGGEDPARSESAELRARIGDDWTDPRGWIDLAGAYRRENDPERAKDALERAHTLAARAASERPDDGAPLAELGLVLAATGDDAGADKCVAEAARKTGGAWAGVAARADLLVLRALAKASGTRFVSLDDAYGWLRGDEERAADIDPKPLAAGGAAYDEAVSLAERAGVKGRAGSSVYIRRNRFQALLGAFAREDEPEEERSVRETRAAADEQRARELQAEEPDAITMEALQDAMGEADDEGTRHVLSHEQLSDAARRKLLGHVASLSEIARGPDSVRAARALQGGAALHWFVRRDAAATEAALRRSVEKDPTLRQSWNALVLVLAAAQRWDDLGKLCAAWCTAEDGARQRMMFAKSLWAAGYAEAAETNWRAALALEPKSPLANVGVAVLVLRRAKTDADVAEARKLVRAATDALAPDAHATDPGLVAACGLAEAVALGLAGERDACEKAARGLLEKYGEFPQAREVLAAIGR